ncbi:Alpha/beta hydrolase family, putative [Angomonas deanei]|uniref:Alpha/beta hydrolase family, putative n=1 Tax=Angomonas deanei TaxID=59799 RepID=A0A7G2CKL0_9TRYP|nr:Alpha/beta hydrolase family, putative [Angomonas deanei]
MFLLPHPISSRTKMSARAVSLAYKVHTPPKPTVGASSNIYVAHGLLGNAMNWATPSRHICGHPMISKKLNKLYAVDMRNHGASPHNPNHSCAALASDLESFVLNGQHTLKRELSGVTEAAVDTGSIAIGHSMGGLALMGLLLRRYNEDQLLPSRSGTFGKWKEERRRECAESMRSVNEQFNFPETQPIRDILFSDSGAVPYEGVNDMTSRIPKWGRIRAAVIVDVTPVIELGTQHSDEKADTVYGTLYSMTNVDLSRIHSYDDVKEELLRVGMKSAAMRDFVTTNIVFNTPKVASWRCNLDILFQQYGAFKPSIVDWFMAQDQGGATPKVCTLPVLFVFGEKSPYQEEAKRKLIPRFFPNSRQVVVPGAGHFVHYEKTAEFVEKVVPFMSAHM